MPPAEALAHSLDAFLEWVEGNELAYRKLIESAGSVPEVGALIAEVRDRTSARILEGLGAGDSPQVRAAARAWLWFVDGAILDWLEHRDLDRAELGALPARRARRGAQRGRGSGAAPSTQRPSPPSISFFQIGASAFTRSMISRAPANASPRCGAETATITLGSDSGTSPTRCSTAAAHSPWRSTASDGDRRHALLGHLGVGVVVEPLDLAGHA